MVGWVGVLSFVTTFTFPYLMAAVSGQIAFWIYAVISFVGFLFIATFVPETRGKTEEEIKLYFTASSREDSVRRAEVDTDERVEIILATTALVAVIALFIRCKTPDPCCCMSPTFGG